MSQTSYTERARQFQAEATRLSMRYNRLAIVRLVLFLIGILGMAWLFELDPWVAALALPLAIMLFVRVIRTHRRIQEQQRHNILLARINAEEAAALAHDFSAFDSGIRFLDAQHSYSGDLDLFGSKSLFQAINRCATPAGQEVLAGYLSVAAPVSEVIRRQEAVREIAHMLAWRQDYRAYGLAANARADDIPQIEAWLKQPQVFSSPRLISVLLVLIPILTCSALAITVYRQDPWWVSLACVLPSGLLIRHYIKQVNAVHARTTQTHAMLTTYARLIRHIEQQPFLSPLLQQLQQSIQTNGIPASEALRQLAYLVHQLEARNNPFILFFNLLGLWDLQWVYRLEQWKIRWQPALSGWFHTVAELEALASLGNVHYNEPSWCFPVFSTGGTIRAKQLGHPLIPASRRVGNDLSMPARGHIKLITGSNMAGKSTFLRTVGINLALAQCGAPVCAASFELSPVHVYTSMRTQDALSEQASSFYAELRRLHTLIEYVRESQEQATSVFFLLDEILKGTNSRDRYQGAAALIRQLIRLRGAGLIATHDLELTTLEQESHGSIENLCIDVRLDGSQLVFDYTLRPGISQTFNATQLMRDMGIDV